MVVVFISINTEHDIKKVPTTPMRIYHLHPRARMCSLEMQTGVLIPLHAIAVVMTGFRLFRQWKKRLLWWDDFFAAAGLLGVFVVGVGIAFKTPYSVDRAVILFMILLPIYVTTCVARISIGLSIMKICASSVRTLTTDGRAMGYPWPYFAMNALFFIFCVITMVPGILSTVPKYCINADENCPIVRIAGTTAVVTDWIADGLLVFVPLYILWHVKLPKKERRMVLYIFAAGAISSIPALAYLILVLVGVDTLCILFLVELKVPVTVMVCNFLVIVTYVYCLFRKEGEEGDEQMYKQQQETQRRSIVGSGGVFTHLGSAPMDFTTVTDSMVLTTVTIEGSSTSARSELTSPMRTSTALSSPPSPSSGDTRSRSVEVA